MLTWSSVSRCVCGSYDSRAQGPGALDAERLIGPPLCRREPMNVHVLNPKTGSLRGSIAVRLCPRHAWR